MSSLRFHGRLYQHFRSGHDKPESRVPISHSAQAGAEAMTRANVRPAGGRSRRTLSPAVINPAVKKHLDWYMKRLLPKLRQGTGRVGANRRRRIIL